MTPAVVLELNGVTVGQRLSSVRASVLSGRLIHIIGPNGAGKSTLLACMGGLLSCDGETILLGRALDGWRGDELALRRAYLCQQELPLAAMPVFQYLALHQPANADGQATDRTVSYLASALSLADKLVRPLSHLSGGEWQRVRLAAVLLQIWPSSNPLAGLLLLDEPATGLDIAQRVALDGLLAHLIAAGIGIVICAHDLNHTLQQAQEVWLMSTGRLVAQGSARDIMRPDVLSPIFDVDFTLMHAGERPWLMAHGHGYAAALDNHFL